MLPARLTWAAVAAAGLVLSAAPAYASGSPVAPLPWQQTEGMMPVGAPDAAPPSVGDQKSAAVTISNGYVQGTDVSSYQHPNGLPINWQQVAASGQTFTVIKATEATNYTNPYLLTDVAGARRAGLYVGLYHFAQPQLPAIAQADWFAREINGIGGAMLPPVLDLEQNGGLASPALIAWTSAFLARLTQDTGRVPMIYTGPYFWSSSMAGSTAFNRYRLWEAHYTLATAPQAIPAWPSWSVWQYSNGSFGSPAAVPGIPAHVDRDQVAGTRSQLAALVTSSRPGVAAPFNGTATAAQFPDGTFVQVVGDHHVYEIAGLAPMWVSNWAHVGGAHPVRVISWPAFLTLRSSPLEGTFLVDRTDGHAYRVVGGAPVVVTSWTAFAGVRHYVGVDDWDITMAGVCGGYCKLLAQPRDGTIIRSAETHEVYVMAGGAPVYVSAWSVFGGPQPYFDVNAVSIERAGTGTFWNHLRFVPADGTVLSDSSTGALYQVTAGHPAPVVAGTVSGTTPFTLVDDASITNAGGTGAWSHLT